MFQDYGSITMCTNVFLAAHFVTVTSFFVIPQNACEWSPSQQIFCSRRHVVQFCFLFSLEVLQVSEFSQAVFKLSKSKTYSLSLDHIFELVVKKANDCLFKSFFGRVKNIGNCSNYFYSKKVETFLRSF